MVASDDRPAPERHPSLRRKLLLALATVLAVVGIGVAYAVHVFRGEGFVIVVTEPELQAKAAAAFPISKTYLLVFKITYSDPVVRLDAGSDRVAVGLTATPDIEVDGRRLSGTALVSGTIRYEPAQAAFFLDGIRVESLDIAGLPERYRDESLKLTTLALSEYYAKHPVHVLSDADMKRRAARLLLRSVDVQSKALVITLGL